MRPIIVTKTLVASSANNIALSQTPTSGTALTLNGSTVSGGVAVLDTQRRILLTYGNEASPRTMVITGTDDAGMVISETLSIPSGAPGTVPTLQNFKTVTSALPLGGGWSAAVTLGTNTVGSTPWFVPTAHIAPFELGVGLVLLSGAATFSFEATREVVNAQPAVLPVGASIAPPIVNSVEWPGLAALAATTYGSVTAASINGWRLTVLTGTGLVECTVTQSGIRL